MFFRCIGLPRIFFFLGATFPLGSWVDDSVFFLKKKTLEDVTFIKKNFLKKKKSNTASAVPRSPFLLYSPFGSLNPRIPVRCDLVPAETHPSLLPFLLPNVKNKKLKEKQPVLARIFYHAEKCQPQRISRRLPEVNLAFQIKHLNVATPPLRG